MVVNTFFNIIKEKAEEIFSKLGPGYKEHIYVNAMIIELRELNYSFSSEVIIPITYKEIQLGYERADIIIYKPEKCILEFKAINSNITKKETIQLEKYLKNTNTTFGILLNFGNTLEVNKIMNLEFETETETETEICSKLKIEPELVLELSNLEIKKE